MVSERSLAVLRVIVEDYVATREPVGSKSIVARHNFGVSSATIRNDMAILEEEELIAAPHTSSGRVPTDKGYRLFVDHLADLRPLSPAQRQAIAAFLDQSGDLDDLLARTVRLLAELTRQVAVVQHPSLGAERVRHLELVPLAPERLLAVLITDSGRVDQCVCDPGRALDDEDLAELRARMGTALVGRPTTEVPAALAVGAEALPPRLRPVAAAIGESLGAGLASARQERLVMAGTANLLRTENDFRGSVFPVLDAIERQVTLLKLIGEMRGDETDVLASIGRENAGTGLEETSVLAGAYGGGARLGLVGPTRMDYSNNMAAVRAVARYLTRLLGED